VRSEQEGQRCLRAAARKDAILSVLANRERFMIDHQVSRQNVKLFSARALRAEVGFRAEVILKILSGYRIDVRGH
jgi:hypothetical protein